MANNMYVFGMLAIQLGVALFCANQLFLRQRHQRVYVPLALFFAALAIVGVVDIIDLIWSDQGYERIIVLWGSLSFPITMAQPLLFWLYVRALTSEDEASPVTHKGWHALPLVLSVFMIVLIFMLPRSLFEQQTLERDTLSAMTMFTLVYFQVMELIYCAQISIYLFLTMRMLSAYSARLKDLFATTENRELSWIWWITTVVSAYLLLSLVEFMADLTGIEISTSFLEASDLMDAFVSLAITWVIGIWGLRQQPGLMRKMTSDARATDRSEMSAAKYERSALTDEHATRIAGKIEKAMSKDMLYRDPNLSLWDLAKHISVTSNYVSQTLNMTLQSNFFDYVNKWRIQDAVKQLHDTEETILVIAYDVGFNSRSSFYNAFKREMGTTPSALRTLKPDGAVRAVD
jgi:AraC-like DNA-binding protein